MKNKKEIRDKLFEFYSRHLSNISNLENKFICPLCLTIFSNEHIECLSIEHIIPEALGGKILTITCSNCNNEVGSKLFSKLKLDFEQTQTVKMNSETGFDAKITNDVGEINGIFRPTEEVNEFFIDNKRSNPYAKEKFESDIQSKDNFKFTISWNTGYSNEIINRSLYAIAYLFLFYYLGYKFIFSNSGLHIKEYVKGESDEFIYPSFSLSEKNSIKKDFQYFLYINSPENLSDYIYIQIPLELNKEIKIYEGFIPLIYEKFDSKLFLKPFNCRLTGTFPQNNSHLFNYIYKDEEKIFFKKQTL